MSCLSNKSLFVLTFTKEQDDWIIENYGTCQVRELVNKYNKRFNTNRTYSTIRNRVYVLRKKGLLKSFVYVDWTEEEKKILSLYFTTTRIHNIQKKLFKSSGVKRSIPAIKTQACKLGVLNKQDLFIAEHFTVGELVNMSGKTKQQVLTALHSCKDIQPKKIGKHMVICVDALDKFMEHLKGSPLPEECYTGQEVCNLLGISCLNTLNKIYASHPSIIRYKNILKVEATNRWGTKAKRNVTASFYSKRQIDFIAKRYKETMYLQIHWKKWLEEYQSLHPLQVKR